MKDNKKIILIVIIVVVALLLLFSTFFLFNRENNTQSKSNDIYNQQEYKSVTLPNIAGNNHTLKDEFGKTQNTSDELKKEKVWTSLRFNSFTVYSLSSGRSTIKFEVYNPTNDAIESDNYQLQLLDDTDKIVSIIDFDSFLIPSLGKRTVEVSVTGDVTNIKDIKVDDINYTMKIQEVK